MYFKWFVVKFLHSCKSTDNLNQLNQDLISSFK